MSIENAAPRDAFWGGAAKRNFGQRDYGMPNGHPPRGEGQGNDSQPTDGPWDPPPCGGSSSGTSSPDQADSRTLSLGEAFPHSVDLPPLSGDWLASFEPEVPAPRCVREHRDGDPSSLTGLPDAWWASFGNQLEVALLRSSRQLSELLPGVAIGSDDRVSPRDDDSYPFTCICRLRITAANGREFLGTGWLADRRTVITAGHCVYMHRQGGWASRVTVTGVRGLRQVAPAMSAERLWSVHGWTRDQNPEHDYGAIRLSEPHPHAGSLGFGVYKDDDLRRFRCHIVGYPCDRADALWGHARRISEIKARTIGYARDVYGGNSGAPVLVAQGQDVFAIGIHQQGDLSGNLAVRITPSVFSNIRQWQREH